MVRVKIKTVLFICAGVMWAQNKNHHIFNNKIVSSPVLVAHRMLSLLRQWSPLTRQKEKLQVEDAISKLVLGLRGVT